MKQVLIAVSLILFSAPLMAQGSINLAWDPHEQAADLAGFPLYQSRNTPVCPGGVPVPPSVATFTGGSTTTGSISAPTKPGRYYWAITAITPDGIESNCSNEVSTTVKPKPPKLNSAVQAVLTAPVKAVTKVAGLFKGKKGLRIVE